MSRAQTAFNSSQARNASSVVTISEFRPHSGNEENYPFGMDRLFFNDIVRYQCSCKNLRRLYDIFLCRHCLALRCRHCVLHEVDSQYCQHCLEYIPTIDTKFQMNKCASCYNCPSCQHLLSTTILTQSPAPDQQQQQSKDDVIKRTCQLVCEFCRWSSDTFLIGGSRVSDDIPEVEIENASRISELMSFYKTISAQEKADKKKRRFIPRSGNTMDLLKKYGIDNTLSPKLFESLRARTNFNDKPLGNTKYSVETKSESEKAMSSLKPSESMAHEELDKLDVDFYYSKDFELDNISSLSQRLAFVEVQPDRVAQFKPISKSLSVKRSLRCKECERNLCRSEYSPLSIRFKVQSSASYHVPELKLRTGIFPMNLKLAQYNIVEFSLQNQTLSKIKVKLSNLENEDTSEDDLYELILPPSEMVLSPSDGTMDYEHIPFNLRPLNEETQITFQTMAKVGFFLKVKPKKVTDLLVIKFLITHDLVISQNPKESDKVDQLTHIVSVKLGPIVE